MYLYVWCVSMDMYACLHVQGSEYEHQASYSSLTILFSWDGVPQWTQSWGWGSASSSHPPVSTPRNTAVKDTHRTALIPAGFWTESEDWDAAQACTASTLSDCAISSPPLPPRPSLHLEDNRLKVIFLQSISLDIDIWRPVKLRPYPRAYGLK